MVKQENRIGHDESVAPTNSFGENLSPENTENDPITQYIELRTRLYFGVEGEGLPEVARQAVQDLSFMPHIRAYAEEGMMGEDVFNFSEFLRIHNNLGEKVTLERLINEEVFQNVAEVEGTNAEKIALRSRYLDILDEYDPEGEKFANKETFDRIRELAEKRVGRG